jgi:type I restriction enzyme S subunit
MDGEFNCSIWNGNDALLNQRVCRIIDYKNTLRDYVFYNIKHKLKEIEEETYAVTVKHISSKQILNIEIPLPPIKIQEEIVKEIIGIENENELFREKIDLNTRKIKDRINKIWGE